MLRVELSHIGIEYERVLVHHHLIDDVLIKFRRTGRHLDPLLLHIELLLGQAFLIDVVHLAKGYRRIRAHDQRLYPLLVDRGILNLIAQCQLPDGAFS